MSQNGIAELLRKEYELHVTRASDKKGVKRIAEKLTEAEAEEKKGGGYDPFPRVLGSVFSGLLLAGLDWTRASDRDRGTLFAHPTRCDR